jgi:hypothetical protein
MGRAGYDPRLQHSEPIDMVVMNKRVWGLQLQVIGLAILLAAMAWQTFFSDWFDKTSTEWQYFIQSEVNNATTLATLRVTRAMAASAPSGRAQDLQAAADAALRDLSTLTLERDERRARAERRSLALKYARFALFVIGALVLLAGVVIAAPKAERA